MPSFHDISIKLKLTIIIMLTATIVLILSSVSFVTNDVISFRETMVERLSTIAEIIGSNSAAALIFNDRTAAEETLSALADEPHIVSAWIYQNDGKKFADYVRQDSDRDLSPPSPEANGHHFEDDHLILFQKIMLDGEAIGTVYVQSDIREMYSRLKEHAGIAASIMLFVSVVAFFLSSTSQGVISEPILRLAQTARTISRERNYAIRAEKQSKDEIGDLIDGFNEMLSQIQDRDAKLELNRSRLEELVSNAAEALPDGDKVTISTKNEYIDSPIKGYDEVKEGDYVVLKVSDNGVGISDTDLEKIFEPFYTKKKMTAFKDLKGNGERILIIDDVKEQRQVAMTLLTRFGYAVEAVSSGEEAIEYSKIKTADLFYCCLI